MNIHTRLKAFLVTSLLVVSGNVFANTSENCDNDPFSLFTQVPGEWTQIGGNDGNTNPGSGGQDFDAEYLFYKYDPTQNNLSIGLQTGFDLIDGQVDVTTTSGRWYNRTTTTTSYFAGDLALSFDGNTTGTDGSGYEYAIDFGLFTETLAGNKVSIDGSGYDTKGLYSVAGWNNDVISDHVVATPFAMDDGTLMANALISDSLGSGVTGYYDSVNNRYYGHHCGQNQDEPCTSYYRIVTFNLDDIVTQAGDFTVDAHWTMSCGNDYINGSTVLTRNDTAVPEPSILALFSLGSLGLVASGYRRRKMQK